MRSKRSLCEDLSSLALIAFFGLGLVLVLQSCPAGPTGTARQVDPIEMPTVVITPGEPMRDGPIEDTLEPVPLSDAGQPNEVEEAL